MPLPASVPTITVTGTLYRQTGLLAGTPAAGTITFAAPQLRVAADNTILPKQTFTATLDANGSFSVVLLTTTPSYYVGSPNWAYSISASLTDATFTSNDYQFPEALGSSVDLADVNPVTDPGDCDLVTCATQEEIATLQAEIEQEIEDRIAADDVLQGNIDAEEAAREAADLALQGNIDTEEAARIAEDNVLQGEIDAIVGGGIVTSIIAGNGIDVSGATGDVTVSAEFGTSANQVPQANTVVYLTGNQTIAGNKTFSGTSTIVRRLDVLPTAPVDGTVLGTWNLSGNTWAILQSGSSGDIALVSQLDNVTFYIKDLAGAIVAAFTTAATAATASTTLNGEAIIGGKASLNQVRFPGANSTTGAPASGTHVAGEIVPDSAGVWWLCTVGGTPGTWVSGTLNLTGDQTIAGVKTFTDPVAVDTATDLIIRFQGRLSTAGAPVAGTYAAGDLIVDVNGVWWLNTAGGTPGTWTTGTVNLVGNQTAAGAKTFSNQATFSAGAIFTGSGTIASGVAALGAKNSFNNIRFAGFNSSSGAPASGTWTTGDLILDSLGVWWLCTSGGTPGTWVTGTVNLTGTQTAAGVKTWSNNQIIAPAASGATAALQIAPVTPVDGTVLLRFETDRPWFFKQTGAGASTNLMLTTTSDGKLFIVANSASQNVLSVQTATTVTDSLTTIVGSANIGGKNSLSGIVLTGRRTTAGGGPPTTGTWATSDTVQDVNGRIWYCTSGGTPGNWVSSGSPQIDVLNVGSGNWTKPTGATMCDVVVISGGGGGGGGRRGAAGTVRCGGGGGGGGSYTRLLVAASALPSSVPYVVGVGGGGGAGRTTDDTDGGGGTAGGNSVFNDTTGGATTAQRVKSGNGSPGNGGTNASGTGGGGGFGQFGGATGAAASTTGGVGVVGPDSGGGLAAGGSGGGITSGDAVSNGGAGGVCGPLDQNRATAGVAPGGSGGTPKAGLGINSGNGGAGGASSITGVAGSGSAGANYGAGGGGGGASLNGNNSGAGGNGGPGVIQIVTYF